MSKALCITINGAVCAVNVGMYAAWQHPWSLAAAVAGALTFVLGLLTWS